MSKTKVISEIEALLEEERAALYSGELEKLVKLIERKRELIQKLNAFGLSDLDELDGIKDMATKNQALFDSALRGIKSVQTRLATLQKVRRSLDTYDEKGRRLSIKSEQPRKLEKRA